MEGNQDEGNHVALGRLTKEPRPLFIIDQRGNIRGTYEHHSHQLDEVMHRAVHVLLNGDATSQH